MSQDKDEIVKMAREAGFAQDWQFAVPPATLSSFATLCRAPLVAEVERLKAENSTLLLDVGGLRATVGSASNEAFRLREERDDWKARALKAEQVGEPFAWARPDAVDVNQDFRFIKIDDFTVPLYTTPPQPAAREPASAVPVVEQFLQDGDRHLLRSFIETTEDDEGYMLTKPEIKRLAELGVVQSHGFGKYSVTMFGHWVHERYWHQNPSLPLKTNTDRTADAAIAAGQQYLKENKHG